MEWIKLNSEGKGIIEEINESIKKQEKELNQSLGVPKRYMDAGQHIVVSEEFTTRFNKFLPK